MRQPLRMSIVIITIWYIHWSSHTVFKAVLFVDNVILGIHLLSLAKKKMRGSGLRNKFRKMRVGEDSHKYLKLLLQITEAFDAPSGLSAT